MKPTNRLRASRLSTIIFAGVLSSAGHSFAADGTWIPTAGTNSWNNDANWTASPFPNGAGEIASLNINLTATTVINLNTAITVGTLNIGDSTSGFFATTINPNGGSLTFDNGGSTAQLNRSTTGAILTDTIAAGVTLTDNLLITNATGDRSNPLALTGKITGTKGITIAGGGNVYLSNVTNDYSGGLTINNGGILQTGGNAAAFGSGTITLNAGASIDTSFSGAASQSITTTNANIWNGSWTMNNQVSAGTWTNNGTVSLGGNVTLTLGNNLILGNVVSESVANRSITKAGNGALTLNAANTYNGGTTLSAGTLNINNSGTSSTNSAIGTGRLTIAGGTINNSSAGAVILATNNLQTWSGNFAFTGTRDLNLGTGAVTISGSNRTATVNGGTLTVGGAIGQDVAGRTFTKAGIGTLVLTGTSSYTGTTTVSGGTLVLAGGNGTTQSTTNGNTAGSSITIGANTIQLQANGGNTASSVSSVLNKTTGTGSANAVLAVGSDATIQLRSDSAVTFATNSNAAAANIGGINSTTFVLNLNVNQLTGAGSNNALTLGGSLLIGRSITVNVTGGNGYSLNLPTIGYGTSVQTGTYTLNPTGANVTVGSGGFINGSNISPTLILGGTTSDNFVNGAISNSTFTGNPATLVTKSGTSTWTLSAANGYTGATNITGGKLSIASTGTINGTSGVTIGTASTAAAAEFNYNSSTALTKPVSFASGSTLGVLSGTGTINSAVSITVGNTLSPGNSAGVMSFADTLGLGGGVVMEIVGTGARGELTGYDGVNITGALTYGGTMTLDFGTTFTEGTYNFDLFNILGGESGDFTGVALTGSYTGDLDPITSDVWNRVDGLNTWNFTQSTGDLSLVVTAIPEPKTALLGAIGVIALLRRRR